MNHSLLEIERVNYNAAAIKTMAFKIDSNSRCIRLHWHDRIELLRVTEGSMRVTCGNDTFDVSAGQMIFIPPRVLHEGYTLEESVKYNCLMFDVRYFYNETEICKKLLPAVFDGRAVFRPIVSDRETLNSFDSVFQDRNASLATASKIYSLIGLLYCNNLIELRAEVKDSSVKRIIDYIEENAREEITENLLSRKFSYSKAYLCRKFKEVTGLSPMAYLKIYRLESAAKKIANREASISDIAKEFGFSDANYFTRCFKAHFGVSPSRYGKLQ